MIEKYPGVKVCFSLSGVVIDQLAEHQPEVLKSFRDLAQTGSVEFLGETYYHSLSSVVPTNEFIKQVQEHRELTQRTLAYLPTVFRNTDLIYSSSIGSKVSQLGYSGVICDGAQSILGTRNPHHVYKHPTDNNFKILFRNNVLSDEIAFRFSQNGGIDVDKYIKQLYNMQGDSVTVIGLDYETFGEHNPQSSGILDFLEKMIVALHTEKEIRFTTPSEVIAEKNATEIFDVQEFISWFHNSKDLSAWLGTDMQRHAFNTLNSLEEKVLATGDVNAIKTWRNLQSSDHFHYMSAKPSDDKNVLPRFTHFESPNEAFINYMNVLTSFSLSLNHLPTANDNQNTESQRRHENVPVWAQQYASHVANTIG